MTDYQYHKEALRKQRLIERKQEAIRRMEVEEQAPMTPLKTSRDYHTQQLANDRMNELQTEHAEARRGATLPKFRVSDEGFNNRYRHQEGHVPHCDRIYRLMYPSKDNSDYTLVSERNNRIQNVSESKYFMRREVNGDFDMKVLLERLPAQVDQS